MITLNIAAMAVIVILATMMRTQHHRAFPKWRRSYSWRRRTLADGTSANDDLMRKWDGDRWIYRQETEDEALDRLSRESW